MSKGLELPLRGAKMRGPAVDRWEAWRDAGSAPPANAADFLRNYENIKTRAHEAIRRAVAEWKE